MNIYRLPFWHTYIMVLNYVNTAQVCDFISCSKKYHNIKITKCVNMKFNLVRTSHCNDNHNDICIIHNVNIVKTSQNNI